MITATLGPVSSDNQTAIWVVIAIVAAFAICAVLYQHERVSDRQGAEIAWLRYQMRHLLKDLGREIPPPVKDDSPKAMAAEEQTPPVDASEQVNAEEPKPDEMPTGPVEIAPATVPDGIPLAVQAALLDQRPSPVPRGKSAEWVEAELARFNFTGRDR